MSIDARMIEKEMLRQLDGAVPKILVIQCNKCDYLSQTDKQLLQEHNLQEIFCNKYHEQLLTKVYEQLINKLMNR